VTKNRGTRSGVSLGTFCITPVMRVRVKIRMPRLWRLVTLGQMTPRMSPALRAPPLFRCAIHPNVISRRRFWLAYLNTTATGAIRPAWHSAQRHQGGGRRPGDSRGAECRAGLILPPNSLMGPDAACRQIGKGPGSSSSSSRIHAPAHTSLSLLSSVSPSHRYATSGPPRAADQSRQASLVLSMTGCPLNQ